MKIVACTWPVCGKTVRVIQTIRGKSYLEIYIYSLVCELYILSLGYIYHLFWLCLVQLWNISPEESQEWICFTYGVSALANNWSYLLCILLRNIYRFILAPHSRNSSCGFKGIRISTWPNHPNSFDAMTTFKITVLDP